MKWRLWHGRVNRAIRDLQELLDDLTSDDEITDLPTSRLRTLAEQLLTYIASNRSAIINYGKRYRSGLRVASTLAESAVNSLVGKRMAKSQQMRWSSRRAHAHAGPLRRPQRRAPRPVAGRLRTPAPPVPSMFRRKPLLPARGGDLDKLSLGKLRGAKFCSRDSAVWR